MMWSYNELKISSENKWTRATHVNIDKSHNVEQEQVIEENMPSEAYIISKIWKTVYKGYAYVVD